jgi:hypothetical protein
MKSTIKIFVAFVMVLGFAVGAKAQVGQSAHSDVTGHAVVATQVTVATTKNLEFKNVTPGVAKTIDLTGNVSAGVANGGESIGQWTVTKGESTQVALTFSAPSSLAGKVGGTAVGKTLPITYTAQLSGAASAINITSSIASGYTVSNAAAAAYYALGSFNVDLGGTVSPDSNQTAGEYESNITLTATYN